DKVANDLDLGLILGGPILSGDAAVKGAEFDIARHFLGSDQRAGDLGVINVGEVAARAGRDAPAGLTHQLDSRLLEASFWEAEVKYAQGFSLLGARDYRRAGIARDAPGHASGCGLQRQNLGSAVVLDRAAR
ncbi:MAG: hypothetical protein ACI8TX_003404, partial [Hyphomicrobiaceae bacterium]